MRELLNKRLDQQMKNPEFWPREAAVFLLGFSGGPDSMALLRLLAERFWAGEDFAAESRLVVCHFDHGWRSEASVAESDFCRESARALNLPYEEGSAASLKKACPELDLPANALGETAARRYRRAFFERLSAEYRERCALPVYLLLAHQREDRAETLLLNIFRGCGPRGLAAMPARDGLVLRPLLSFSKQELLAYLAELGQAYLCDETNAQGITPRNRLRLELFPLLEEIFADPVQKLNGLAAHAEQTESFLSELAGEYLEDEIATITRPTAEITCLRVDKKALAAVPQALKARLWAAWLHGLCPLKTDLTAAHLALLRQAERLVGSACQPFWAGSLLAWDAAEIRLWRSWPERLESPALYWPKPGLEDARPPLLLGPPGYWLAADENAAELRDLIEKAYEVGYNSLVRIAAVPGLEACCWRTRRSGDFVRLADGQRKSLKKWMSERRFPAELRGQMLVLARASEVLWLPGYFREWRALPMA